MLRFAVRGFWPFLFKGELIFFTRNIKGGVCYFEFFKRGFYNKGKPILKEDNVKGDPSYISETKILRLIFFQINGISSESPVLQFTTTILHERWLKSIQTFPICDDLELLFLSNSSAFLCFSFFFLHVLGLKHLASNLIGDRWFLHCLHSLSCYGIFFIPKFKMYLKKVSQSDS